MSSNAAALVLGAIATKRSILVSLTLLLYDNLITLESEVTLVWSQKWSFGKALFLFNRYFGPVFLISNAIVYFNKSLTHKFCLDFILWENVAITVAIACADVILQLRIYAVYNRKKIILFPLLGLFALGVATSLGLASLNTNALPVVAASPGSSLGFPNVMHPIQDYTGCFFSLSSTNFVIWIPPLVFEMVLCLMMLYKAYVLYRESYRDPLFSLIIRDSVLYFMTIFAVLLCNCLFWALDNHNLSSFVDAAVNWSVTVPCVIGSRLLLNIRERYIDELAGANNVESAGVTTLIAL